MSSYFCKHLFLVTSCLVFSIKLSYLQRLFLNEKVDIRSCKVLRFEDDVEMEQLKSHLRAGWHKCQLYLRIHALFLLCNMSPSSAVLLKVLLTISGFFSLELEDLPFLFSLSGVCRGKFNTSEERRLERRLLFIYSFDSFLLLLR